MFANQGKRSRVNYEEALADYPSNRDVSPGGGGGWSTSASSSNKRRGDIHQGMSSSTLSSLMDDKRGCYQQFMELLIHDFKQDFRTSTTPNEEILASVEFQRAKRQIDILYNPKEGDPMGCGSDEALALGITENADEDKAEEYPPTLCRLPLGTPKIIQVFAGGMHSGVVTIQGNVLTFGQNDDGALGRNVTEDDLHLAGEIEFPRLAHGRILYADGGDNYTLFLTMEGTVYFCGTMKDIDSGKFAPTIPSSGQTLFNGLRQLKPIHVSFPQTICKISAGDNAAAALGGDGTLYTFGMGHMGELGRSKSMGASPIKVERQGDASSTHYMSYDLGKMFMGYTIKKMERKKKPDGTFAQEEIEEYCYNTKLIAEKFMTPAPVEFEIPGNYTVIDMAMGQTHMIVIARVKITDNNTLTKVFATGLNQYGQLGLGHTENRHCLTEITAFRDMDTIHQVAVGAFHTLFLNATGTAVYSCGRSDYGQLGLSDRVQGAGDFVSTPTQIAFPETTKGQSFVKIVSGGNMSSVIIDNGDCYTWGYNTCAQTGHSCARRGPENSEDILVPTKLRPMRAYGKKQSSFGTTATVLGAACGGQHSLFLVNRYVE